MKRRANLILTGAALAALLGACARTDGKLSASGTIEATEVRVSSTVQGRVLETLVREGEPVEAGRLLARIDPESYRLQEGFAASGVEVAEAQLELLLKGARREDLAQAEAALASAEEALSFAASDAKRMRELEAGGSATRRQREDAEARLSAAQAAREAADQSLRKLKSLARPEELRAARARVEQAEWSLRIVRRSLAECEVRAPAAGIVTARLAEAGELAAPGSGIVLISDLSSLSLRIYLPEAEIGKVTLGGKAAVSVDSFPGRSFDGTVAFISPRAEFTPKNVQTRDERVKLVYAVRIDLGAGEGLLKPGMPADADLED